MMENEKKKTGYQSTWQDQLRDTANKIINREKFSYDLNGDALYKQYKDNYTQQGKMAMMDTMGQAQAMTGGYGNSYAQAVGQQAYQGYMQQLNDKIPSLYQIALDKYTAEGNQLRDNMNMLMQMDDIGYERYRDDIADQQWDKNLQYQQDRDKVSDQQWRENFEYSKQRDELSDQRWDQNFRYQQNRDTVGDQQWRENFDYVQSRDQAADREDAYNKLVALMTGYGYKPTASELANAGMTEAQMNSILGINNAPVSPSSVGGAPGGLEYTEYPENTGEPEEGRKPEKNFDSVVRDVNAFVSGGADMSEIQDYLQSAYSYGYINQGQYQALRNKFAPASFK